MTDQEILRSALEKAAENGSEIAKGYVERITAPGTQDWNSEFVCRAACLTKDFAIAFWGEDPVGLRTYEISDPIVEGEPVTFVGTYVLEDNPVQYLEQFLKRD
jgi:hypothetical protein